MFTKKDLEPYMMIEDWTGEKFIGIMYKNELIFVSPNEVWKDITGYSESFIVPKPYDEKYNIKTVWSAPKQYRNLLSTNTEHRVILFNRTEKKSVTISELCELAGVDFDSVNII